MRARVRWAPDSIVNKRAQVVYQCAQVVCERAQVVYQCAQVVCERAQVVYQRAQVVCECAQVVYQRAQVTEASWFRTAIDLSTAPHGSVERYVNGKPWKDRPARAPWSPSRLNDGSYL